MAPVNGNTLQVLKEMNPHNHGSDAARVQASLVATEIARRAGTTTETPAQIVVNALQGQSDAVLGKMPKKDAIRKRIQRKRNKEHRPPPVPTTLQELVIPDDYRTYHPTDETGVYGLVAENHLILRIVLSQFLL